MLLGACGPAGLRAGALTINKVAANTGRFAVTSINAIAPKRLTFSTIGCRCAAAQGPSAGQNEKKTEAEVFRQDFLRQQQLQSARQLSLVEGDPFGPIKTGTKALVYGFILATIACIGYGAYDKGYRNMLKNTYPFAWWVLSLYFGDEEPVTLSKEVTNQRATEFRSKFLD